MIANINPCIKIDTSSVVYTKGVAEEIFLKDVTGNTLLGKNSKISGCYYPDFLNPNTNDFWVESLQNLSQTFNFYGIWLDENEISDISGSFFIYSIIF